MLRSSQIPEVSRLTDFNHFAWFCALRQEQYDILTLCKIEGTPPPLPDQYLPPSYAFEFVVRGSIRGSINHREVVLPANSGAFFLTDQIHGKTEISPDCQYYVLAFTARFAEMLAMYIPQAQLAQLMMRPVWQMTEQQMAQAMQYIDLLRKLIEQNQEKAVVHLVRSLFYCLAEDYAVTPQQTSTLSRAEQICGLYLSLVELHCREQHTVEWYASQLCLAPKYLSNVLKQTLNTSPNAFIDDALTRQARSLLSSTSLSVQQISDRLGFQNQSHFGTFFKRRTGLSPIAFKEQVT